MLERKQLALVIALAVVVALSLLFVYAKNTGDKDAAGKTITATGCLAKGDSPNEFYLTADNGQKYELRSDSVSLSEHVEHKVTVKGTAAKESEAKDTDRDEDERDEARESKAANLQVTDLQMVSSSCK